MPYQSNQAVGDYVVEELLGAGGVGEVYRARHSLTGRLEALKIIRSDLTANQEIAERFLREIQIQAGLSHPNVAAVHDAFWHEGRLVMAMELIEGRPLRSLLDSGLGLSDGLRLICQCLEALSYAHGQGVVHRDVSPQNLIVSDDGALKLTDFGLAKAAAEARLTRTGAVVGSLYSMAPEQVRGERRIDPRIDVYAVGAILYEIVSGRPPFDGENVFDLVAHRLQRKSISLDPGVGASPELEALIQDAMADDPRDRLASADEFLARLSPLAGTPTLAPVRRPTSRAITQGGRRFRRRLVRGLALAVPLLAGGFALTFAAALRWYAEQPLPRLDPPIVRAASPPDFGYLTTRQLQPAVEQVQAVAVAAKPRKLAPVPPSLATPGLEQDFVRLSEIATGPRPLSLIPPPRNVPELPTYPDFTLVARHEERSEAARARVSRSGSEILWWSAESVRSWADGRIGVSFDWNLNDAPVDVARAGDLLASASLDGEIRFWNPVSGKQLSVVAFGQPVRQIVASPNGKYLAVVFADKGFRILTRVADGGFDREPMSGVSARDRILASAFSGDDSKLVLLTKEGKLSRIGLGAKPSWTRILASGLNVTATPMKLDVTAAHLSKRESLVAVTDGQTVEVWDSDFKFPIYDLHMECTVRGVEFMAGGRCIALCSNSESAMLYDVRRKTQIARLDVGGPILSATLEPGGEALSFVTIHGGMERWATSELLKQRLAASAMDTPPMLSVKEGEAGEKSANGGNRIERLLRSFN